MKLDDCIMYLGRARAITPAYKMSSEFQNVHVQRSLFSFRSKVKWAKTNKLVKYNVWDDSTTRLGPLLERNPGLFGPIPVQSGHMGLGCFGLIST